ncbi:MAG: hypothetical protein ACLFU4_06525 [Opitutales bacterium]
MDEIQRAADLFATLRGIIDTNREEGRPNGQPLVVKVPSSETWAIEIKHGTAPKTGKHYSDTCDDVEADRKYIESVA